MILKAAVIWIIIALAETLQGILRIKYLNRRIGDHRARQVGVSLGSAIILIVCWFSIPWIGSSSTGENLAVGALWVAMMLAYDIALGRMTFRFSWRRIAKDFDLRQGGFLGIGMLVMLLAPMIVTRVRELLCHP